MYFFLIVLIIILSILLVLVVLAQKPKGGGLSGTFGGGAVQIMGVRKTTDILERVTWIAVGLIMVLSVIANTIIVPTAGEGAVSPNVQEVQRSIPSFLEEDTNADSSQHDVGVVDSVAVPIEELPSQ